MLNVLFVCARNKWRSPTAEKVFSGIANIQVASAGLSDKSPRQLSIKSVNWADIVFVMEYEHRKRIVRKYRDLTTLPEIICLNIADDYQFMDPKLIRLLETGVRPLIAERIQRLQTES